MKQTKTIISVFIALILLLALAAPAYAAGTITVSDPGTESYKAYKIFDVTVGASGNLTYTLDPSSPWKDVLIDSSTGASLFPGLTFTPDDPLTKYTVEKGNTFSAADFAVFLRGTDTTTGDIDDHNLPSTADATLSGDPVHADVAPGYYLVISNDGTSNQPKAALTTVLDGQNVRIQNKNDMPFDKTVDDQKEEGVQVGDTVNFKITSKVPTMDPTWTSYIYLVSDTMDAGLTFDPSSLNAKIGVTDVTLTTITDPSALLTGNQVRYNANNKTFELSIDLINETAGAAIEITYSAVVNENAAGTVSENNAVLEYGNNPNELTIKDSQTKVYTSKLIIDKYEKGAPEQKLSGAQFVLRKAGTKDYYKVDADGSVSWVTVDPDAVTDLLTAAAAGTGTITAVETDANGAAAFNGLNDGDYELIEIAAPAGYTRIADPIPVTIDGSASTAVGLSDDLITLALTNVANVENTPGTNLPSTGGIGTTIFYFVGSVLILGAAVVLIARKRKSAQA